MTVEIGILLATIAAAMVLFAWERVPTDVVALGVLLVLIFTGLVPARTAFAGFGSDAVIMILGLLILTSALRRTGVVELVGNAVLRHAGENAGRLLFVVLVGSSALGAFISNTASTAFFVPIVFRIATKAGVSPSRFLMPLAFSSILSSSVTLVSTSTNVVVSGMMTDAGLEPMGMFELAPVGIPIALAGLAYLMLIGRRFIPDRAPAQSLAEEFGMPPYLSEIRIAEASPLAGKTLEQSGIGREMGLTVVRIAKKDSGYLAPHPDSPLAVGDTLLVEGQAAELLKNKQVAGIEIGQDVRRADPSLATAEIALAEAIILPGSPLIGRTLSGYRFRDRHELQALAVNHHGENVLRRINEVALQLGDMLLLEGRPRNLARLQESGVMRVLSPGEALDESRPRFHRAPVAIAIFGVVLALVTFEVLSLPVAAMFGAFLVFATGCLTPDQAYDDVEWKAVILIGCMLSLGVAMEGTGASKFFAAQIVALAGDAGPRWLLGGFFVLAVILTQPMSNQAAAIVLVPVAIETALHAGLNPRTFTMMIAVAASCSYLTPLEPSCMMVYGPGRYRFIDFLRAGAPLTVLIFVIAMVLVPIFWPLQ